MLIDSWKYAQLVEPRASVWAFRGAYEPRCYAGDELLRPRVCVSAKLDLQAELEPNPGHTGRSCGSPKGHLALVPDVCTLFHVPWWAPGVAPVAGERGGVLYRFVGCCNEEGACIC